MTAAAVVPVATAVPLMLIAAILNVSKLLAAVGLIAKTIPLPQWVPVRCLQYHQVGSREVTVYLQVGAGTTVLLALAMKPESGASTAFLLQGAAKVDSVTVWF